MPTGYEGPQVHMYKKEQDPHEIVEGIKVFIAQVAFDSLRPRGLGPARLLCPRGSTGKTTRLGSQSLLQGLFLTQVSCTTGTREAPKA